MRRLPLSPRLGLLSLFFWGILLVSLGSPAVQALNLFGTNSSSSEPLPPEQAFALSPPLYDGKQLLVRWEIAPDYYLYRDKFALKVLDTGWTPGTLKLPHGKPKEDEFFGSIEAVYQTADLKLALDGSTKAGQSLQIQVNWQGCSESLGVCYPPETRYFRTTLPSDSAALSAGIVLEATEKPATGTAAEPAVASAPAVTSAAPLPSAKMNLSEQELITARLASEHGLLTLLAFLGFGLLLAFTPCVFPMLPILSGIIAGQKELSTRQAFTLSLTYVLAMALTYTLAGVLAGLFGANIQVMFQKTWVIVAFSVLFVALALSMFGFYELQMPRALQQRLTDLSNRQAGGTLIGVAIMGVLSALIVGPCVAAPLAGALAYIGQTGDALFGGAALFALSLGMGIPLLIIGTWEGRWLPRSGAWMEGVKAVFGVMLLGVAIWMLERILPEHITLFLWAALFIMSAIYLGVLSPLNADAKGWQKFRKGLGVLVLVYGIILMLGAASGGRDVFQPLLGSSLGGNAANTTKLNFKPVASLADFNTSLAAAKGKPVMLDFYADWCVSCKEMEKYTFSNAGVHTALKDYILLKADVTANTPADRELLARFGLYGPPATLFFTAEGQERKDQRLVGYINAENFINHLLK